MAERSNGILRLLDLEPVGEDAFLAPTPTEGPGRLFGGQVASQSLRAACLTVEEGRPPHSLHAYFILPGRPGEPLRLDVQRSRDGRSFTTRHVTASQNGSPIFELVASFHAPEDGYDWQLPGPSGITPPEDIEPPVLPDFLRATIPFDMRLATTPEPGGFPIAHPFWIRSQTALDDDPALHACVMTFLSDMGVVGSARAPGSLTNRFSGASLDHAVWFHRKVRMDDWVLMDLVPHSISGGRGFYSGTIRSADGSLAASLAQEALFRARRANKAFDLPVPD
jgi:acyl-CoA thioesterase-2